MAVYVPDQKAIQELASPEVFNRGKKYWKDGAVSGLVRRGDVLSASVDGSEDEPYAITVKFSKNDIADTDCTCPYDFGGACKHIVAALLSYAAKPTSIKVSPPIADLLAKLDRDRLQALLMKRLDSDRALAGWLEAQLALERGRGGAVDAKPIARQAHAVFRKRYRNGNYWDGYSASGDIGELKQLVDAAVPFLEAGDGRNALKVLETVTETFVEDWIKYASGNDEHMYELFNDLGRMIAEAALMSDLDADERGGLADIVGCWKDDLAEYGVDEAFDPTILALETGWDAPGLADALAGRSKSWRPDDNDWASGEVVGAMLRVLDAQDRHEEYLNLARATRHGADYGAMLVRLGRAPDAAAHALTEVEEPEETLAIANALDAAGSTADALKVAEHGLGVVKGEEQGWSHGRHALACWLRDRAAATDHHDLALIGAHSAFELSLTLADYRMANAAAGAAWPELRHKLLAALAAASHATDRIAIYLEEGMIDEAVGAVEQAANFSPHDDVLMRLVAAARRSHPDWVIGIATRMSDAIMDNNQAGSYELAARWLEQAMHALDDDGRTEDWLATIGRLIETHRRKHKLRPLLEALRAGTFSHA